MPGINGYETAKRFSVMRPGVRILCMSGYAEHASLRDSSATGNLPLLEKPFSTEVLLARVRDELGTP
jgi:DNA-binding NtrC family response regulator